jgi:hypothetical protein
LIKKKSHYFISHRLFFSKKKKKKIGRTLTKDRSRLSARVLHDLELIRCNDDVIAENRKKIHNKRKQRTDIACQFDDHQGSEGIPNNGSESTDDEWSTDCSSDSSDADELADLSAESDCELDDQTLTTTTKSTARKSRLPSRFHDFITYHW